VSEFSIDSINFAESYKQVQWGEANCKDVGTEAFYIQDDERSKQTIYARSVCVICPIQQECLIYALKHERFGMWGAMTAAERNYIVTKKLGGPGVRAGLAELQLLGISLADVSRALRRAKA
tara:strand:- start:215 stop:577 length:363 start_codon:yes stop_codon:yes gene_type:complete